VGRPGACNSRRTNGNDSLASPVDAAVPAPARRALAREHLGERPSRRESDDRFTYASGTDVDADP
jgi:hypothetical protein